MWRPFVRSATFAEALTSIQRKTHITHIIVEAEREHLLDALKVEPVYRDGKHVLAKLMGNEKVEQSNALDGE